MASFDSKGFYEGNILEHVLRRFCPQSSHHIAYDTVRIFKSQLQGVCLQSRETDVCVCRQISETDLGVHAR